MKTEDPGIVEQEMDALGKLARRAPNDLQRAELYSLFSAIAASPQLRKTMVYIMNARSPYTKQDDFGKRDRIPSAAELATDLEKFTDRDDAEKLGIPKTGWWSQVSGFVRGIDGIRKSSSDSLERSFFKAAYYNEGLEADLAAIHRIYEILERTNKTDLITRVLKGNKAITPFFLQDEANVAHLLTLVQQGVRSRRLEEVVDIIETLSSLEAPEELWDAAHYAVVRSLSLKKHFNPWGIPKREILRYIKSEKAERVFILEALRNDGLWEDTSYGSPFISDITSPEIYRLLTDKLQRKATLEQLTKMGTNFHEMERERASVGPLGYVLAGRKVSSLRELVEVMRKCGTEFLSERDTNNFGSQTALFPNLIRVAGQSPPKKLMLYFRELVETGAPREDVAQIVAGFPYEHGGKINHGKRAKYAGAVYGKEFERNRAFHTPRTVSPESQDPIERSAAALNSLYNEGSGMEHQAIIGRHVEEMGKCYTLAFADIQEKAAHLVLMNSMMFDPEVTEENCGGCQMIMACKGMHDFTSVVLFNPDEFDRDFLLKLQRTIPGTFELQGESKGIHRTGNFVLFPNGMEKIYFAPQITIHSTPIETRRPYQSLVVFPINLAGSTYFAKSLRTGNITLPEQNWPADETVVIPKSDWQTKGWLPRYEPALAHLAHREVQATIPRYRGIAGQIIYYPGVDEFNFGWRLSGNNYLSEKEAVTIGPVHPRRITAAPRME